MTIADAPWIREAEMYGVPCEDPPTCPICGRETDSFYVADGEVIGCDHCVKHVDAWDYEF